MPFAGSAIAIVFYRFVYMKTQLMVMKDQEHHAEEKAEAGDEIAEDVEQTMLNAQKTLDE
jgi:hypothetical protein